MLSSSAGAPNRIRLGIIGLGLVGHAIAERVVAGGFALVGCDLDPGRAALVKLLGGIGHTNAAEVFTTCERVLLSLPSHREVQAMVAEHGAAIRPGTVLIDTTTGDPAVSVALAQTLQTRQVTYLDATISGSSAQVREGNATLMVGGSAESFRACTDIFSVLGRQTFHTGPVGSGAKMKLVTNVVLGLNRAALAEGLALAGALGMDLELTLAVMRSSAAYSRIMDTKGTRMIRDEFAPDARLSQHLKDVRLIMEMGRQAGLQLPLSAAHRGLLEAAEAAGCGELDNSAIIKVLRANGGHGGKA